jgi:5'-AMP-activated protein kinase regulatory beta subunit
VERIRFRVEVPRAKKVMLAGDFTDWGTNPRLMRRATPGGQMFVAQVTLAPGTYQYKFIVDGAWVKDPQAQSVPNCFGTLNSLCVVGD